jgi:hypothetical protein
MAARPLLSGLERRLYGRLVRAFPGHVILSQVAMSVLLPAGSAGSAAAAAAAAAHDAAHDAPLAADGQPLQPWQPQAVASFVVCKPDFTPLAVIELDGLADIAPQTHPGPGSPPDGEGQGRRLESAGIKRIRVAAGDLPSEAALKALVAALPLGSSPPERMRRAS